MTQTNDSTSQANQFSLIKRMLIGATIGFMLLSLYVFGVDEVDPAWGKFWRIRPLFFGLFAGAMGGLCNYYIMSFRDRIGISKILAIILSLIVFIIGLWMGVVVGLDGTMWD